MKHSVFVQRRGCCELALLYFIPRRLRVKKRAYICCMVVVPLFLPALLFFSLFPVVKPCFS